MSATELAYVLDSHALLAYLQAEPGMSLVRSLLGEARRGAASVSMCMINLGEVLYIVEREQRVVAAQAVVAAVDQLPIRVVVPDRPLVFAAAHVKAGHALSYADAFAVALAQRENAALVTGDPEFRGVADVVRVAWLSESEGL